MRSLSLPMPLANLAAGCLVVSATAAAAATPDMRDAIVVGGAPNHPADAPPPAVGTKPRLRAFAGTMRVEGQEGERFWGTIESPTASEEFIDMFTGVAGRFIRVDVDGLRTG